MENRFGFRDLVICVLLVAVIVVVVLAMFQFDRQWDRIKSIESKVDAQTKDLAEIRRALSNGVTVSNASGAGSTTASATSANDPFDRIKAARANPDYAQGDWLVDNFGANVRCITPFVAKDAYGVAVGNHVLENLANRDPVTLQWKPMLAESWTVSDDGLLVTFKLRKGVTFSDGVPLTLRDFVYTYELAINPKLDAPQVRSELTDKLASVTVVGDDQVAFKFKECFFDNFAEAAGFSPMPEHFYGKYTPEEISKKPGLLMGTGPYRMETPDGWTPGKLITLYRNERYWGVAPGFERLIFKEILGDVAEVTEFRNGKVDIFHAQPEQYLALVKDPEILAHNNKFEFERSTGGYGFIGWNENRDKKPTRFADKRVRQAMTMMVNTQKLFDDILLGFGIPVTGPFNRNSHQCDSSLKPYPFDVEKAKALLKDAGYTIHSDGLIYGPDDQPFKFTLTYPSDGDFWKRVALLLRDDYAKAGVIVNLDPQEWAIFEDRLKNRSFDAICLAWSAGIEDDVRQMFHSSQIEDADNFISYRSDQVDKLIDTARRTVDENKRMPVWQAVHRQLYEDQPYTFLYSRRTTALADKRLKNIQILKIGMNDQDEWYVPGPAQKWKE